MDVKKVNMMKILRNLIPGMTLQESKAIIDQVIPSSPVRVWVYDNLISKPYIDDIIRSGYVLELVHKNKKQENKKEEVSQAFFITSLSNLCSRAVLNKDIRTAKVLLNAMERLL
jgi:hypothetical protein